MPKSEQIVAALADISAIANHETLKAEIVDLFRDVLNDKGRRKDERAALIMRKMINTIDTVPYDMLAEFGHNYNPELLACMIVVHVLMPDILPDYADAHDLMDTMLNDLRTIDLDHPDTHKAIEMIRGIFKEARKR